MKTTYLGGLALLLFLTASSCKQRENSSAIKTAQESLYNLCYMADLDEHLAAEAFGRGPRVSSDQPSPSPAGASAADDLEPVTQVRLHQLSETAKSYYAASTLGPAVEFSFKDIIHSSVDAFYRTNSDDAIGKTYRIVINPDRKPNELSSYFTLEKIPEFGNTKQLFKGNEAGPLFEKGRAKKITTSEPHENIDLSLDAASVFFVSENSRIIGPYNPTVRQELDGIMLKSGLDANEKGIFALVLPESDAGILGTPFVKKVHLDGSKNSSRSDVRSFLENEVGLSSPSIKKPDVSSSAQPDADLNQAKKMRTIFFSQREAGKINIAPQTDLYEMHKKMTDLAKEASNEPSTQKIIYESLVEDVSLMISGF